jgi:hypothetical protein
MDDLEATIPPELGMDETEYQIILDEQDSVVIHQKQPRPRIGSL